MTSPSAGTASPPGPVPRLIPFYATMFLTQGVASVYAGIWFASLGISEARIGLISAAPVLALLLLNIWVGRVADRADDWRSTIIAGGMISGFGALLLPFVTGFWTLLLPWTVAMAAIAAVIPVADAATMRLSRRAGFDYSAVRAWATIGYLVVLLLTGYLLSWFGAWIFLPLFCATGLIRAATTLVLPRFRAPAEERTPSPGAATLRQAMRPWFLLPLISGAIIYATHQVLTSFQALLWAQEGIEAGMIGLIIALGAASEAAAFFLFKRWGARVPARWLILLSAVVSALRWAAYGFSPPVPVLIGLQMLHAITFALGFLGCLTFIANWTSEEIAAEAQSFLTVLQQAFSVVFLVIFGWLAGEIGAQSWFVLAAVAAAGCIPVWLSLRHHQPRKA